MASEPIALQFKSASSILKKKLRFNNVRNSEFQ